MVQSLGGVWAGYRLGRFLYGTGEDVNSVGTVNRPRLVGGRSVPVSEPTHE